MKFLCDNCKAKYQIADDKVVGKTVRMKCRKCGHLIEIRAAVTETSVSSQSVAEASSVPPPRPRAPAKPMPPRATALGTSVTSARPPGSRPKRPSPLRSGGPGGALAGAFKSNVQHEEEVSTPFDMSELSAGDEWYVAINGVPVGPIRVSEVRRKAALGAVTEDSLVWQEGLDEWRPLRSFAELATIVREATSSGRSSLPPPAVEARLSAIPPHPRPMTPGRPASPSPGSIRPPPRPIMPASAPSPFARNNVVAITSRLATAERLDEASPVRSAALLASEAQAIAAVASDPFAPVGAAAIPPNAEAQPIVTSASMPPPPAMIGAGKKAPPWMAIAMVASAVAFGVTAAIAIFSRPPAPAPATSVLAPTGTPSAVPSATASMRPAIELPEPSATAPALAAKGPAASTNGPKSAASAAGSAAPAGRALDLHSLTNSTVTPAEDPGSEGAKAPGQCLGEGQVQQVIGLHQVAIRRSCWERNPTTKPTVSITVATTVGPDGSAQNVAASGDEPSVAHCIENDVRSWHFPAMGCSQKTSFSFKFVRQ